MPAHLQIEVIIIYVVADFLHVICKSSYLPSDIDIPLHCYVLPLPSWYNCSTLQQTDVMTWQNGQNHYLLYFSFLFLSGLTTQGWSVRKYHITKCHRVTGLWVTVRWYHMTKSHGNHGKIVYRPCSSCISSIGNLMGTLLSSPCQLRLGVVLRHLSVSPYTIQSLK